MSEKNKFTVAVLSFLSLYFIPLNFKQIPDILSPGFLLLQDYVREHTLFCLLPAFFIAGALVSFISKDSVLKFLGGEVKKTHSYAVASVSGLALTVCSCTVLPLFAGIRKQGAGLGPAITFLFSGPAVNIVAIMLVWSVLGPSMGFFMLVFAISIAILSGLTMQAIFRESAVGRELKIGDSTLNKPNKVTVGVLLISLLLVIISGGLGFPTFFQGFVIGALILLIIYTSLRHLNSERLSSWTSETWGFFKMLTPALVVGIFVVGVIMPLIPESYVVALVGNNTLSANLIATLFGAFTYFVTLTEIPILKGFMDLGMHGGPAMALLLSGPSVSLPNMLVIRNILGTKRTAVYIALVIFYSTIAGFTYGLLIG